MLYTKVRNGILFMSVEGEINDNVVNMLDKEIDYMLYRQGINYFAFNFLDIEKFSNSFLNMLQNKLVEIFLRCGRVALYGINKCNRKLLGSREDSMFYVDNQKDINRLLSL